MQLTLQFGYPRLFKFQVLVDMLAVIISMIVVSKRIHPIVAQKIAATSTTGRYLLRTLKYLAIGFGAMLLYLLITAGISVIIQYCIGDINLEQIQSLPIMSKIFLMAVHAITAIVSAPIWTETYILMTILFLSLYWLIIVFMIMVTLKVSEFVVYRIATYDKGPVLAIAGLLTGVGAIAKALS